MKMNPIEKRSLIALAFFIGLFLVVTFTSTAIEDRIKKHNKTDPDNYVWVCTVKSVRGEFVTIKPIAVDDTITLHRFTKDGKRRDFLFPIQKLEGCNHD